MLNPRHEEVRLIQKHLENQYFADLNNKAAREEINDIMEKRQERM